MKVKVKKAIPFDFVVHELESLSPHVNAMFGAYAVYVQDKIVFILSDHPKAASDRGVWLATTSEHHDSLREEFPSMRSLVLFGPGPTSWQVLSADLPEFEDMVMRACQMVLAGDLRIGKVPAPRGRRLRPKGAAAPKSKGKAAKKKGRVLAKRPKTKPRSGI